MATLVSPPMTLYVLDGPSMPVGRADKAERIAQRQSQVINVTLLAHKRSRASAERADCLLSLVASAFLDRFAHQSQRGRCVG